MVRLDINLLPPKKVLLSKEAKNALLILILTFLILALIYVGLEGMVSSTRAHLQTIETELQAYAPLERDLNQLTKMEGQVKAMERYYGQLLKVQNDWQAILLDLARNMPTSAVLQNFTANASGQVSLQGVAPRALDVARFYFSLSKSHYFKNVSIISIVPGQDNWSFNFSCLLPRETP